MEATIDKPKRRRRANGDGCIFQRGGRWFGKLTIPSNGTGRQKCRWVSGDTQREVLDKMTDLRKQRKEGSLMALSRWTVQDWIAHWIKNIAPNDPKKPCRATTLEDREKAARLWINPHVGNVKLSKLTRAHVEAMHGALREAGLSNATVRMAHSLLARVLSVAVDQGIILFNAAQRAGSPPETERNPKTMTKEQAAAFVQALTGERLHAYFVLSITCSCRPGELMALKRDDIDLTAGTITIRRTLRISKKLGTIENPPKSNNGYRTIKLPAAAVVALKDHFRRMLIEGTAGSSYVFHTTTGASLQPRIIRDTFNRVVKAASIPAMTVYQLRHTSISLLLASRENPKAIAVRAGHDVNTMLRYYAAALPGADDALAAKFDDMLATKTAG
jgi:integrase